MRRRSSRKSIRGFTLIEILVAMGVGLVILAAALELYTRALDISFMTQQRAEMQLDVRAAQNMMVKDIGNAGVGLDPGGVALVTGATKLPVYGCDQTKCYLPVVSAPSGLTYPVSTGSNYLYWIIPGNAQGATISALRGPTDAITVVYSDTVFPYDDYTISFNNTSGTSIRFTEIPDTPAPGKPTLPFVKISDPVQGLKKGDLVLFTNKDASGNTQNAVGEVTADATGVSGPWDVSFSTPDVLNLNQSDGTSNGMKQLAAGQAATTTAVRLYQISYYLDQFTNPVTLKKTPVLMRQVNGQTPVPVTENIIDLKILYEVYDDAGNLTKDVASPTSPNMIHRVVVDMTARSALRGIIARTASNPMGYQSINVRNSISTRNMSFKDRYPQ